MASAEESARSSTVGSSSPRVLRDYHKGGSGSLQGGGVDQLYDQHELDIKAYKSKLDARLGYVLLAVFIFMATILCIHGIIHGGVQGDLADYVNRTHQIAVQVQRTVDEKYVLNENATRPEEDDDDLTVEELEGYASDLSRTSSAVWTLFVLNLVFAVVLVPILVAYHCELVQGTGVKILFRVLLAVCLLFLVVQFFFFLSPLFTCAVSFPGMVDRLFSETAHPRDDYKIYDIEHAHACQFKVNEQLVRYDLQSPCVPKLKNSLFPVYATLFLLFLDIFPFLFAVFTYAWSACIKDHQQVKNVRTRVHVNQARRAQLV